MADRLNGYRVLILETREEAQFSRLLSEQGADVLQCPMFAINDAPDPAPIEAWIGRTIERPHDDLVLMTGEGLRRLMKVVCRIGAERDFVAALGKTRKFTRGPKPGKALREIGLEPQMTTEKPTSEGVAEMLSRLDLAGRRVGLQLYPDKDHAALIGAAILPGATIPRPAPPLSFVASNGAKVDLASLKGKVVVVEILSTTCPHCQNSSRLLARLKNEMGAKGMEVIGYAFNPDANVAEFARMYAPNFPVGKGDRDTAYGFLQISLMQQFYFPQIVFVDRAGMIRAQYGGTDAFVQTNEEANVRGMLQKLLAEGQGAVKAKPAARKKTS